MKRQHLFLLGIIGISSYAFGQKNKTIDITKESNTPIVLALENITNQKGKEVLSSLHANIEYIALETTNESIIGGISKITRLANGHIVVAERESIMMFDAKGKFIRPISQKGNGPADFNRICSLVANPHTGDFFLLTTKKVVEFDAKGEYIKNFEVEDRLMDMVPDPVEKNLILHQMSVPKKPQDIDPTWFLFRYNLQGKEVNRYEDITPRPGGEGIIPLVTPIRPLYAYKNTVRFNEFGNDTIFNIGKEGLSPFVVIDLGKMRMSASPKATNVDAVFESLKEKLFLSLLTEDDQFFYMTFGWGFSGDFLYAIHNKQTGQTLNIGNGDFLSFAGGLENDVDGGLPFYPYTILPDGSRIQWKSAEEFKENIQKNHQERKKKYGDKFEKVYRLAESLEEDDNPVLIIAK